MLWAIISNTKCHNKTKIFWLASEKFCYISSSRMFVLVFIVASCCFWTTCILMSGDKSRLQTKVLKLCCRLVSLTCAHDIPRWENTILLLFAKQKFPIKTNFHNFLIVRHYLLGWIHLAISGPGQGWAGFLADPVKWLESLVDSYIFSVLISR